MSMVRNIYNAVLEDSGKFIQHNRFNIGRLTNIDNDAIKSLYQLNF